jgi:hypothetical protein
MTDDARLRRTQALAPFEPYGLDVARWLMSCKIQGQGQLVLRRFGDSVTAETISDLVLATDGVETIDELRQLEAIAAALYFGSWSGRPETAPHFVPADRRRIPPHWSRFEGRRSVLASSASNRKAERPVNSTLNYIFAIVEAEAILACQAVGLDPGLGLVHSDTKGRASLALDVVRPIRPAVEAFVLDLVAERTFRKADFVETSDGHVRLRAPFTHKLAETLPGWRQALGPIAERVARVFGKAMDGTFSATTPLTGSNVRDGSSRREGPQGGNPLSSKLDQSPPTAGLRTGGAPTVDLPRLRRSCHKPSPCPLRGVHRRRPGAGARDPWQARCCHRGPQEGAL